jgi:hypothetical protein
MNLMISSQSAAPQALETQWQLRGAAPSRRAAPAGVGTTAAPSNSDGAVRQPSQVSRLRNAPREATETSAVLLSNRPTCKVLPQSAQLSIAAAA